MNPKDIVRRVSLERSQMRAEGNTMVGYPIVYNQPTEINSWEGKFTEIIAPGAAKKSLAERGSEIKVLFNHGVDVLGNLPLGVAKVQREDDHGLYVEVELDQARSVQEEIVPRLRSGSLDGMSFRFSVEKEDWNEARTERTIRELKLYEYGPVTFPAYAATSVGIRSRADYDMFREAAAALRDDEAAAGTSPLEAHIQRLIQRKEIF